jgi:phosphatidylserine decarboxylase
LKGRRNPFIAREGMPFLLSTAVLAGVVWNLAGWLFAVPVLLLLTWLFLIFRDPRRPIPASPLGVVSPVDGRVVEIDLSDCGVVHGEVHRVLIQVDSFGTYTARSPVEGKIMDLRCDLPDGRPALDQNGLWVRTDEDQDVLLQFRGHRFGIAPRAFARFGERVGQGQRCAYLRLTRIAEVQVPLDSRILVTVGQRVRAGADLLARLPAK